jgi:hypothetical protein
VRLREREKKNKHGEIERERVAIEREIFYGQSIKEKKFSFHSLFFQLFSTFKNRPELKQKMLDQFLGPRRVRQIQRAARNGTVTYLCLFLTVVVLCGTIGAGKFGT